MKFISSQTLLLLFFVSIGETVIAKSGYTHLTSNDSVSVTKSSVEFFFPIPDQENWEWFKNETNTNSLEYKWEANFRLNDKGYGAGFLLFKRPRVEPESGSFNDLIGAGQISLTSTRVLEGTKKSDGNRVMMTGLGSVVRNAKISYKIENGYLVIILKEEMIIEQFYEQIPETITYWTKTPNTGFESKNIKVSYHY